MKKNNKICLLPLFFLILSSISVNNSVNAQQSADAILYLMELNEIAIDGEISEGEYPYILEINDLSGSKINELAWAHNTTHLAIAISCDCIGWIGIGLGNAPASMINANLLVGNVTGSVVNLEDMHANNRAKVIKDDDSLIDVNLVAGKETGSSTIFEFIIPMISSDITGHDHNWEVNGTYGFFTAIHDTIDDFYSASGEHTTHSQALTVDIVGFPAELTKITLNLTVQNGINNTYYLNALVVKEEDNDPIADLEVDFFTKTKFGNLFHAKSLTNGSGIANATIITNQEGNLTFIAIFPGSIFIQKTQTTSAQFIEHIADEDEKFGDLRDDFNREHLIRDFLLFLLSIIMAALIMSYLSVFFDLIRIFRLRNSSNRSNMEENNQ
jgi:hypothetical protein